MKKHHKVKILPIYFDLVNEGRKTFEVRGNDRDYKSSDLITLQEWDNGVYSGRELTFEIGYVLDLNKFINDPGIDVGGFVVFSLIETGL